MENAAQSLAARAVSIQFPEKFGYACAFAERVIKLEDESCAMNVQDRLVMYALRQQGQHGDNTTASPSWWNAREYAMWGAWSQLKGRSSMEAMVFFVQRLEEIDKEWLEHELSYRDENEAKPAPKTPEIPQAEPPAEPERERERELPHDPILARVTVREMSAAAETTEGLTNVQHQHLSYPVGPAANSGFHAPGREGNVDLVEQIQVLKYRLNTALRDVQERDDRVAYLTMENERLRERLQGSGGMGVMDPAPSLVRHIHGGSGLRLDDVQGMRGVDSELDFKHMETSRTATPLPMPNQAYIHQTPKQSQGWMSWFTGMSS